MQIRFLSITEKEIYLLGVRLELSPTEHKLLYEIAKGGKSGVDDLLPCLTAGVNRGNVAVHINSINQKAARISSRKLVVYEDKRYMINPFM